MSFWEYATSRQVLAILVVILFLSNCWITYQRVKEQNKKPKSKTKTVLELMVDIAVSEPERISFKYTASTSTRVFLEVYHDNEFWFSLNVDSETEQHKAIYTSDRDAAYTLEQLFTDFMPTMSKKYVVNAFLRNFKATVEKRRKDEEEKRLKQMAEEEEVNNFLRTGIKSIDENKLKN